MNVQGTEQWTSDRPPAPTSVCSWGGSATFLPLTVIFLDWYCQKYVLVSRESAVPLSSTHRSRVLFSGWGTHAIFWEAPGWQCCAFMILSLLDYVMMKELVLDVFFLGSEWAISNDLMRVPAQRVIPLYSTHINNNVRTDNNSISSLEDDSTPLLHHGPSWIQEADHLSLFVAAARTVQLVAWPKAK